ncbi:MAG: hypothetical protein K6F53_03480 [Lachnospiraceae bacterium]|nr:hypothetical protein [Lachnospiraceae bacterium]
MYMKKCECCGGEMNINPILIRLTCPYCGTAYINLKPLDIKELSKSGKVLNNYKIELKRTDTKVVFTNAVSCSYDRRMVGGAKAVSEVEEVLKALSNMNKTAYIIVTKTGVMRKTVKVLKSIDCKKWQAGLENAVSRVKEIGEDVSVKARLSSALPGYTISQLVEIDLGKEKQIACPRLFNPGMWEREDTYTEAYCAQKDILPEAAGSNIDRLQELYKCIKNYDVVTDCVARLEKQGELAKHAFTTRGAETALHLNMHATSSDFCIWSIEREITGLDYAPVTVMRNIKEKIPYKAYGWNDHNEEELTKGFVIAAIIGGLQEMPDWRLYSICREGEGYMVSFMYSVVQAPLYREWGG